MALTRYGIHCLMQIVLAMDIQLTNWQDYAPIWSSKSSRQLVICTNMNDWHTYWHIILDSTLLFLYRFFLAFPFLNIPDNTVKNSSEKHFSIQYMILILRERDRHILTVDKETFISDRRFVSLHKKTQENCLKWRLEIKNPAY